MSESNERTPLSALLESMRRGYGAVTAEVPGDWLQGRAVYGGLSAALCLHGTRMLLDDLPPLRSAQMAFVGPASSEVEVTASIARRGKSTAFVTADVASERGLATRAALCFGAARESRLAKRNLAMPNVAAPSECGSFFEDLKGRNIGPNFAQHFESGQAGSNMAVSGAENPEFLAWMRHRDVAARNSTVGLAALADALPPAAVASFEAMAPISSMTWQFDLLTAEPETEDGWWLCRSTAHSIGDGYSSQSMAIWNTAGEPVLAGHQNIAVFY